MDTNIETSNMTEDSGAPKKPNILSRFLAFLRDTQNKISLSKSSYLFFCFIVPIALMYLIYVAKEIFPFGNGSVLVLDLSGQYVYFFEGLRNTVYGDGSMLYTFFRSLGGEFMGMYAYYLASPFSYIVALFPQSKMLEALLTIILLKVGCCGLSFGWYLHKNSKNHNKAVSVIFAVMYSLCAYAVVYQHNIMWIDALIWLPLITYGIEQLVKNGKYKLFVISLALCIMSNFYIGYMTCIYVMLYYFYFCFAHSKEEINPHNIKYPFIRSFVRIAVFSLIAVAISAFIILAAYYSLTFGKNEFTDPNWTFRTKFDFIDFFTKFLPGSYDTVRPKGLPFVYCGVLTLFLIPVYFMSGKISSREKIASLAFVVIFVLFFISSPFDLIWHGFQAPNWLNYRYSFMFCFFLLVLAYKGFGNLRASSPKLIFGICGALILFVAFCQKETFTTYVKSEEKLLVLETIWLTIILALVFAAILCLLIRQKKPKVRENITTILAIIVCIEFFCSSFTCLGQFGKDVGYTSYSKYNNQLEKLRPIVNEIKEKDTGFYRMEKTFYNKKNENMALGIRGLSNSTSTLNSEVITFMHYMGYMSRSHLTVYRGGNPVNDSILGIKYIIDNESSQKLSKLYDLTTTNGDCSAYYNEHALSIAYGVDPSVNEFKMKDYNTHFERLNALVKSMLGNDKAPNIFIPVSKNKINISHSAIKQSGSGLYINYQPKDSGTSGYITYTFTPLESGEYYFYPACKKNVASTLYINGKKYGEILGSETNSIVHLGNFESGKKVTLKLEIKESISLSSVYNSIWYFDEAAFEESFAQLKSNPQFNVTEYTEDNLIGNISTKSDSQTIMTTIPFDEGWQVYLDGKKVDTYKTLDALLAFDISSAGDHTLELKYCPTIYKVGGAVSIMGILIFALLCLLDLIFYFTKYRRSNSNRYASLGEKWVLEDFDETVDELPPPPLEEQEEVIEVIETIESQESFDNTEITDEESVEQNDGTDKGEL